MNKLECYWRTHYSYDAHLTCEGHYMTDDKDQGEDGMNVCPTCDQWFQKFSDSVAISDPDFIAFVCKKHLDEAMNVYRYQSQSYWQHSTGKCDVCEGRHTLGGSKWLVWAAEHHAQMSSRSKAMIWTDGEECWRCGSLLKEEDKNCTCSSCVGLPSQCYCGKDKDDDAELCYECESHADLCICGEKKDHSDNRYCGRCDKDERRMHRSPP